MVRIIGANLSQNGTDTNRYSYHNAIGRARARSHTHANARGFFWGQA